MRRNHLVPSHIISIRDDRSSPKANPTPIIAPSRKSARYSQGNLRPSPSQNQYQNLPLTPPDGGRAFADSAANTGAFCESKTLDWMTWWPWRGPPTRSHPELGREKPQRPWYCVLRRGRVGRRQVFQSSVLLKNAIAYAQPTGHTPNPQSRPIYQNQITHAGWSSPVARQAHNLKVTGSNPVPAPKIETAPARAGAVFVCAQIRRTVPMIGKPTGSAG